MEKEQKKSPVSGETGLSQVISAQTNFAELAELFRIASLQAKQLDGTLQQINQFQIKTNISV